MFMKYVFQSARFVVIGVVLGAVRPSQRSRVSWGRPDRAQVKVFAPTLAGEILHGRSPAELVGRYTEVAGRMRPLPDWILDGAVVGMQGGTERVRETLRSLSDLGTPVAAFWLQDWVGQRRTNFGKQLWWNWELDEARYPEWQALVAELKKRGLVDG